MRPLPGLPGRHAGLRRRLADQRAGPAPAGADGRRHGHARDRPAPRARPGSRWRGPTSRAWRSSSTRPGGCRSTPRRRWSRGSASTTSSSSTRAPTPADLATPWRAAGQPVPASAPQDVEVRPRRRLRPRARPARAARRLPPAGRRRRRRAGAAAGARRRLDARQQGPAGHPADAAPGRQGLGLRGDQLPARPARRLARRTSSTSSGRSPGSASTSRSTAGTRRTSRSPAARPAATSPRSPRSRPNDPECQPGFEDADTSVQVAVPHYGVYDFAGCDRAARRRADARPVPRARG